MKSVDISCIWTVTMRVYIYFLPEYICFLFQCVQLAIMDLHVLRKSLGFNSSKEFIEYLDYNNLTDALLGLLKNLTNDEVNSLYDQFGKVGNAKVFGL